MENKVILPFCSECGLRGHTREQCGLTRLEEGHTKNSINTNHSPLARQIGGSHYKEFEIQPVEFINANGLSFLEGNIVKYVCRHSRKGGRKDLEKAIHYAEMLIDLEYSSNA